MLMVSFHSVKKRPNDCDPNQVAFSLHGAGPWERLGGWEQEQAFPRDLSLSFKTIKKKALVN